MQYIGAHVSAAGGVDQAVDRALAIGANALALFTKNQKQWSAPALTEEKIREFTQAVKRAGFRAEQILPHDSYLINLGNPDPEKRKKSSDAFVDEMHRVYQLGLDRLNFHPGAHLNQVSPEESMRLIAEEIDRALSEVPSVHAVIETTAGQGSALGRTFEEIAFIMENVNRRDRVGVCIDTCHIFAGGYDIRTAEGFLEVMDRFDELIGSEKLMGMHLNDAKSEFGSRVDRHAPLGEGHIGLACFTAMMNDARFHGIPLILETPKPELWQQEIGLLRSWASA